MVTRCVICQEINSDDHCEKNAVVVYGVCTKCLAEVVKQLSQYTIILVKKDE